MSALMISYVGQSIASPTYLLFHFPHTPQSFNLPLQHCHPAEEVMHLLTAHTAVVITATCCQWEAFAFPVACHFDSCMFPWELCLGSHNLPSDGSLPLSQVETTAELLVCWVPVRMAKPLYLQVHTLPHALFALFQQCLHTSSHHWLSWLCSNTWEGKLSCHSQSESCHWFLCIYMSRSFLAMPPALSPFHAHPREMPLAARSLAS